MGNRCGQRKCRMPGCCDSVEPGWYVSTIRSSSQFLKVLSGQSIAVIREPPAISIHSLQDGRVTYSLPISAPSGVGNPAAHVTGVWWFRDEKREPSNSSIPDIFKRNNLIVSPFPVSQW